MTKAKSKTSLARPTPRSRKHVAVQREPKRAKTPALLVASAGKSGTKHAKILAMLQSPTGTNIASMMKETGWQQHSIRGFLSGVVRKRLKLNLTSDKTNGRRIYRIRDKRRTPAKLSAAKSV